MRGKVCAILTASTLLLLYIINMNPGTVHAEVLGYESNITNDTLPQKYPAIWGDRIVWIERISDNEVTFWQIISRPTRRRGLARNKDG